ncbi:MAG TPA: shikimate kinase, partial [Acidimicrobiales bacterium]|nr:shikimate kinase [Acidimicrobiales bacterium]
MPTRHVVLIGSMGAGKTTIGDRVARALGRPLVDSDQVLADEGPDAAVIAQTEGVAELHDRECRQLRAALASPEPAVVAAAASIVEAPACRSALDGHAVVWLHVDPDVAASRVAAARREAG